MLLLAQRTVGANTYAQDGKRLVRRQFVPLCSPSAHIEIFPGAALRADIQSCNDELAELMAKEELLKKYQRALGKTQKEIRTLAGKIDVIANIWQSVRTLRPRGSHLCTGYG